MKKIILVGMALLQAGCTSGKTSPERHAWYTVAHQAALVGGNYTSSRAHNYQLNLPQFKEMFAKGQADRAAGVAREDAQKKAEALREEIKISLKTRHHFSGNASDRWTDSTELKDAQTFGNELSATYLDGYEGMK